VPVVRRGSATAYVERGLAIFAVLWQLAWSVTDIAPGVIGTGNGVLIGILVITTVTWLALAATIWGPRAWRRLRPQAIVADIAMLGLAAVVYSFVVPQAGTWPLGTIAAVRACVVATLLLRPIPGGVIASAIAATTGIIGMAGPADIGPVDAVLQTGYAVALAVGAAVLANGLRRSGARLDRVHRALEEEEADRLARTEVARATADHERRIHDQVLNTLAAISRGGLVDAVATRRRCAEAARSLQALVGPSGDPAADPWAEVGAAVQSLGGDWSVEVADLADILRDCPTEVAVAIGVATAEAVRNAARHAGGTRLRITAHRDGRTWRVVVDDDGAGLADSAVPGLGMTRSMRDPLTEHGGGVTWTRSPWGGVRVEIRYESPRPRDASAEVRSVELDTMQVLPQIGPPFLLTFLAYGLVVVLAGWPYYEAPLWALGWFCVAVAVAPFVGGVPAWAERLGLTGGPTWSWRVVLGIGLAMLSTPIIVRMEVVAVGAADPPVWVTWSSEVALSLLFVAILLGPWWTLIPVLAMWVYAQGGGLIELIQPGTFMLVIAALFAASMRRRAREYAVTRQAVIAERALAEADEIDRARREQRFAPLVQSAGALLTALSTKAMDLDAPETRAACLREERVARSIVRIDRDAGDVEALVSDVVVWARARRRFVDAEIVGDLAELHATVLEPGDLRRVRSRIQQTLIEEVPEGETLRLTCGSEDEDVVLRLLVPEGRGESLREWVIGDD
jgi:signal transduction histidine kinase